ncbi:MAG TPA: hypothetical protein VM914_13185 [Pyrinomonadaceae bacterium]|nr:hypothetical protein [Pyrinomonadaceae bacterium]
MPDKRSKYDTDPLDPDFVRRTDEAMGKRTARTPPDATTPFPQRPPLSEEPTRRFDEQTPDASYPSVFVPPAYQPPARQPFTGFGAGAGQTPGADAAPPQPGPASPYAPGAGPSRRAVQRLGIPENVANILPYIPFYVGLVAALVELAVVPRNETRTRFHAAQGLALHIAVVVGSILFKLVGGLTGSGFGGTLFGLAATIFFVVSMVRVWKGRPHHIAPLDDATRWLNEKISPMK